MRISDGSSDVGPSDLKPADIVEKMVEGGVRKFVSESTLMGQVFVIDGKTKIADVIAKAGKDLGAPVSVPAFVRFQLGEGIEKEVGDFAAAVAAAAGACSLLTGGGPSARRHSPLGRASG